MGKYLIIYIQIQLLVSGSVQIAWQAKTKHASSSQVPQNHTIRSIFIIFFHPVSHIPYLHYKVISLHTGENTGVSPTLAEEISL